MPVHLELRGDRQSPVGRPGGRQVAGEIPGLWRDAVRAQDHVGVQVGGVGPEDELDVALGELAAQLGAKLGHVGPGEDLVGDVGQDHLLLGPGGGDLPGELDPDRAGTEQQHGIGCGQFGLTRGRGPRASGAARARGLRARRPALAGAADRGRRIELEAIRATFLEAVREHLADPLTVAQIDAVTEVAGALGAPYC